MQFVSLLVSSFAINPSNFQLLIYFEKRTPPHFPIGFIALSSSLLFFFLISHPPHYYSYYRDNKYMMEISHVICQACEKPFYWFASSSDQNNRTICPDCGPASIPTASPLVSASASTAEPSSSSSTGFSPHNYHRIAHFIYHSRENSLQRSQEQEQGQTPWESPMSLLRNRECRVATLPGSLVVIEPLAQNQTTRDIYPSTFVRDGDGEADSATRNEALLPRIRTVESVEQALQKLVPSSNSVQDRGPGPDPGSGQSHSQEQGHKLPRMTTRLVGAGSR